MRGVIQQAWQQRRGLALLLYPLSVLYRLIVAVRRFFYRKGWISTPAQTLPVVVVGNISVGGTGKTPLCAYLVTLFRNAGWNPAIVSRGYGGLHRESPHLVTQHDTAHQVGDEPLMLFQQTGAPVCVCANRALAVQHLSTQTQADIIFADDGLQHLAMSRVAEIVVVDGRRGLGNAWVLPAGPMREPTTRLKYADLLVMQSDGWMHDSIKQLPDEAVKAHLSCNHFHLELRDAVSLNDGREVPLANFAGQTVNAMAGIGHPNRFFDDLKKQGLQVTGIAMPDHHVYSLDDLAFDPATPLLVTSKDAVKLKSLGHLPLDVYEVAVSVVASEPLQQDISKLEASLRKGRAIKAP